MKTTLFIILFGIFTAFLACSNSYPEEEKETVTENVEETDSSASSDSADSTDSTDATDSTDSTESTDSDVSETAVGSLIVDGNSENTYALIRNAGYNHEAPDSSGVHSSVHFQHIQQAFDDVLNKYVFLFYIHAAIDDDRGLANITDRQRNEIKTDNKSPESLVGQEGETMVFTWKFCLPTGFQTTTKFSHLHQLKGIDNSAGTADVGLPLITLTAYSTSKGTQELRVRYNDRNSGTSTIASAALEDFLGNWVEVTETVRFGENGSYKLVITRIGDEKVLLEYDADGMDMWRTDCTGMRPKWGIYRYLGEDRSWEDQLRDEEIRFADFSISKL